MLVDREEASEKLVQAEMSEQACQVTSLSLKAPKEKGTFKPLAVLVDE